MDSLFDINTLNQQLYNEAVQVFKKYDYSVSEAIVILVSSLFKVDKEAIFLHNKKPCYTIPRWMCWCAMSQFSSLSYEDIATNFSKGDKKYTGNAVTRGIARIREIIDTDPVVRSKWQMVKKFLKDNENSVPTEERITLIVPVGMKCKIDIKEARI